MYRVQAWSIAERNDYIREITETLCSGTIALVKQLILQEVPGIGPEEAEARAGIFMANIDQYASVRWLYAHHLRIDSSKQKFLETIERRFSTS